VPNLESPPEYRKALLVGQLIIIIFNGLVASVDHLVDFAEHGINIDNGVGVLAP
jgi:hypothetical protein